MPQGRGVVAGEDMPTGTFVRVPGGKAFLDPTLSGKGGIVRLPRGERRREQIRAGEPVDVIRDGGALVRLTADAELTVRGARVRLAATETPYLYVTGGRVTGFHGDDRVAPPNIHM